MEIVEPNTLQEAILYFASPDNCREYLMAHRWPKGVTCPRCGSTKVAFQPKYNRWQCGSKHDLRQFTSKTGTIFEDSPLSLDKWLTAMWLVVSCKNGVSSYEIHRAIGVTQKTAWFMDHRIRVALGMATPDKFSGHVEADETFIGGKARNMHASKRARVITGTGGKDNRRRLWHALANRFATGPFFPLLDAADLTSPASRRTMRRVATEKERARQKRGKRKAS